MKNNKKNQTTASKKNTSKTTPSRNFTWGLTGGVFGTIASYSGLSYFFPDQQSKKLASDIASLNEKLTNCESSILGRTSTDIPSFCQEIVEKPYEYVESLSQETCGQLFGEIKSNCKTLTELATKEIYTGNELGAIQTTANEIAKHLTQNKKEAFIQTAQKLLDEATHQFANNLCSNNNSVFTHSCISLVQATEPQLLADITPYLSSILKADASTLDGLRTIHNACQAMVPSFSFETTTSTVIDEIVQEAKNQFISANCISKNVLFQNTCSEVVNNTVYNQSFELLESAVEKLSTLQNTVPDTAENLLTIKENCSLLSNQFPNARTIQDLLNQVTENAYNQFSKNLCDQNALTFASNACRDIIHASSDQALVSTSSLLKEMSHLSFATLAEVNQAKEICNTIVESASTDRALISEACQNIIKAVSDQFAIATCEGISSNFTSACSDIVGNSLLSNETIYILSMLNEIKGKLAQDVLSKAEVVQIQEQCGRIVGQFTDTSVIAELENSCRMIVTEALQKTTYTESILHGISATSESILYGVGATTTLATAYLAQPIANSTSQAINYGVVKPFVFAAGAIQSTASLIKDCSDPENIAQYGSTVVDATRDNPWVTTAVATGALATTAYLMYKNRASLTSPFRKNPNTQTVDDARVERFSAPSTHRP